MLTSLRYLSLVQLTMSGSTKSLVLPECELEISLSSSAEIVIVGISGRGKASKYPSRVWGFERNSMTCVDVMINAVTKKPSRSANFCHRNCVS